MNSSDRQTAPFWSIIFAVFFGNFMATLSTTTINVALPVFMDDFDASLNTVQWMMSGFMLATGVIAPIIGFMGDKLSYKRLYVFALAGFTLTSALCTLAWNVESLIMFRIVQGLFSGIIMPTTMTVIYQVVPKGKQPLGDRFVERFGDAGSGIRADDRGLVGGILRLEGAIFDEYADRHNGYFRGAALYSFIPAREGSIAR